MKDSATLKCPDCGKNLDVIARGKGCRLYNCRSCSDDQGNPVLFYQPVTALMAVKKLKAGALIDLNFNPTTALE